jgi:biopolymer transport protein ExbB/TolQ
MNLTLIIAALFVVVVIAVGRQVTASRIKQVGHSVEARKNTLTGDLQNLSLGISQVQGYIDKMEPAKDQTQADLAKLKLRAQNQLDQAKSLQTTLVADLEKASTDPELDMVEDKMEAARVFIRAARHLSHVEDEDQ